MIENRYLAHHGVKGQSWGERKGPPYPLDPAKRTNAAKKRYGNYRKRAEKLSEAKKITEEDKNLVIKILDFLEEVENKTVSEIESHRKEK